MDDDDDDDVVAGVDGAPLCFPPNCLRIRSKNDGLGGGTTDGVDAAEDE